MKINLVNMNFWMPVTNMKFYEKQNCLIEKILKEKPGIVMTNEYASNQKYIDDLEEKLKGYKIIKPSFDNKKHNRSLMNLIIIDENIKYDVQNIRCCLPNRLIVIDVYLEDGKPPVHAICAYMVQISILKRHNRKIREYLHKLLWSEVKALLEEYSKASEPAILVGDLEGTSSSDKDIRYLIEELGYLEIKETNSSELDSKKLDHILLSPEAELNPRNYLAEKVDYSDHPYISIEVA